MQQRYNILLTCVGITKALGDNGYIENQQVDRKTMPKKSKKTPKKVFGVKVGLGKASETQQGLTTKQQRLTSQSELHLTTCIKQSLDTVHQRDTSLVSNNYLNY